MANDAPAGATAALLIVGWVVVGIVYGQLSGGGSSGAVAKAGGSVGEME